jgi:hypothetical protein
MLSGRECSCTPSSAEREGGREGKRVDNAQV